MAPYFNCNDCVFYWLKTPYRHNGVCVHCLCNCVNGCTWKIQALCWFRNDDQHLEKGFVEEGTQIHRHSGARRFKIHIQTLRNTFTGQKYVYLHDAYMQILSHNNNCSLVLSSPSSNECHVLKPSPMFSGLRRKSSVGRNSSCTFIFCRQTALKTLRLCIHTDVVYKYRTNKRNTFDAYFKIFTTIRDLGFFVT